MSFINWEDKYSVDIALIDDQHKQLFSIINSLHEIMREGKGKEHVGIVVEKLISYTEKHFNQEEEYFKKYFYPETKEHIAQHNRFIDKVVDFKKKHDSGKLFLSIEILNFLNQWLTNHILVTDMKYKDFLKSKGL